MFVQHLLMLLLLLVLMLEVRLRCLTVGQFLTLPIKLCRVVVVNVGTRESLVTFIATVSLIHRVVIHHAGGRCAHEAPLHATTPVEVTTSAALIVVPAPTPLMIWREVIGATALVVEVWRVASRGSFAIPSNS